MKEGDLLSLAREYGRYGDYAKSLEYYKKTIRILTEREEGDVLLKEMENVQLLLEKMNSIQRRL